MIRKPFTLKTKQIIIISLVILFWQFTFPQPVKAVGQRTDETADAPALNQSELISANTTTINGQTSRLPKITNKPKPQTKKTMRIPVTAYSSTVDQCGADPFTTASGTQVRDGIIAANFLPIGTKVRFPDHYGDKIFVVEDRMSGRYWQRADIWMTSREQAKQWGIKYTTIEIL